MAIEKSIKPKGYKIRSWGDLAAVATVVSVLLAMLLSTVWWGLKLESELNVERNARIVLERKVARLEAKVQAGILDVARSEINDIRQDDREIKRRLERLESK